jgi:ubiquinone/menaquinone biosynthesis C-methylase UbiE
MTSTVTGGKDFRLEQADRRDWAPLAGTEWSDAELLYAHLSSNTNIVEAARMLCWEELVPPAAVVLDLGCGSGWLSGLLSRHPQVRRVIAWDASPTLLRQVLPQMLKLVEGDPAKVAPICGDFLPLLLEDDSVDVAVASSAFHHAERPDMLLDELARVVKVEGLVVLLNEVPFSVVSMVWVAAATAFAAAMNSLTPRLTIARRGRIAADHFLVDEELGDRALTPAQWQRLFTRHGFDVEVFDTKLPSYQRHYRRRYLLEKRLTHFLLRRTRQR